ncbi:MAG: hypothetical protein J2P24_09785 [Streptosporangiales bacterium]|nr:hypothetical protein [Streptosporangiales bacterium]MBO0891126.1 hypothetical protein [Acidothermales bacterium]
MSSSERDGLDSVCARLEAVADAGPDAVDDEQCRRLFAAAFRLLAARAIDGKTTEPFVQDTPVNATDVVVVTSMLLEQQNLEVFELALWQSLGGRPWAGRMA